MGINFNPNSINGGAQKSSANAGSSLASPNNNTIAMLAALTKAIQALTQSMGGGDQFTPSNANSLGANAGGAQAQASASGPNAKAFASANSAPGTQQPAYSPQSQYQAPSPSQNPYGMQAPSQQQNPYQQGNQYANQQQNPYQQGNQYANQQQNPYQQGNQYANQQQNPYQQGNQYPSQSQNAYGNTNQNQPINAISLANGDGARALAVGPGSLAIANGPGSQAIALGEGAKALALNGGQVMQGNPYGNAANAGNANNLAGAGNATGMPAAASNANAANSPASTGNNAAPNPNVATTDGFTHDDYKNFLLAGSQGGAIGTQETIDSQYADPNSRFANQNNNEFQGAVAAMYANQFKGYALGQDVAFEPGKDIDQLASNLENVQTQQFTPEAETLSKVAATYRGNLPGGASLYDNAQLKNLLEQWGRDDIASQPAVGDPNGDVQSIGGVVKALNEEQDATKRHDMLQQIFDFDGNTPNSPSGAVPNLQQYQTAIDLVNNGGLQQLLNNYRAS